MTTTVRTSGSLRDGLESSRRSALSASVSATSFPTSRSRRSGTSSDQGLLSPRRTPGGYRLFSEDDIERLESILRLQRDEFPLARHPRGACDAALPRRGGGGRDPISGSAPPRSISSSFLRARQHLGRARPRPRGVRLSLRRSAAASATTRSWTWRRRSRAAASRRACPRGISGRSAPLPIAPAGLLGQAAAPRRAHATPSGTSRGSRTCACSARRRRS